MLEDLSRLARLAAQTVRSFLATRRGLVIAAMAAAALLLVWG
jgi:hypothetical protein